MSQPAEKIDYAAEEYRCADADRQKKGKWSRCGECSTCKKDLGLNYLVARDITVVLLPPESDAHKTWQQEDLKGLYKDYPYPNHLHVVPFMNQALKETDLTLWQLWQDLQKNDPVPGEAASPAGSSIAASRDAAQAGIVPREGRFFHSKPSPLRDCKYLTLRSDSTISHTGCR